MLYIAVTTAGKLESSPVDTGNLSLMQARDMNVERPLLVTLLMGPAVGILMTLILNSPFIDVKGGPKNCPDFQ